MQHGRTVEMIKIFDPIKVFEYSVALIATMIGAACVMGVGHLLVSLIERIGV